MDIIEAWLRARDGQRIKRKDWQVEGIEKRGLLSEAIPLKLLETDLLADDWEIVPTQHKKEMTMGDYRRVGMIFYVDEKLFGTESIPDTAKVTIEWTE